MAAAQGLLKQTFAHSGVLQAPLKAHLRNLQLRMVSHTQEEGLRVQPSPRASRRVRNAAEDALEDHGVDAKKAKAWLKKKESLFN